MPDLIIIVLALIFIVILIIEMFFYIDNRYSIILFLFMASPMVSNVYLTMSVNNASEGESIYSYIRVLLLCFCGAYGYYYFIKNRRTVENRIPFDFKLFAGFIIIAAVSIVFSIDAYYSLSRILSLLALFGNVLGLYAWLRNQRLYASVIIIMFYFISCLFIANLIFAMIYKDRAWLVVDASLRFKGLFSHPNTFGSFCMVSYPVLFWAFKKSKSLRKLAILSTILLMIVFHLWSGSRSSILSSVIIGLLWLAIRKKMKVMAVVSPLLLLIIMLFQIRISSLRSLSRNVRYENSITTLSGRDVIWKESIKLIMRRPFLGYGYDVTGKIFDSSVSLYKNTKLTWFTKKKGSFHNGYITIALGVGFIGLFLWLFLIFSPPLRLLKRTKTDTLLVSLSIMFSCLIVNLMEYTINPASSVSSVFFWIAWTLSLRIIQSQKSPLRPSH